MINEAALLAWLDERAQIRSLVGGAIYQGIHDRITSGQFEQKEGDRNEDQIHQA